MKYTTELVQQITAERNLGATPEQIAAKFEIPIRSIVAKLSSLGLYQRKKYVNKRGEPPIKKEVYVERIAKLLGKDVELLESLEKVNKNVLIMIENALIDE